MANEATITTLLGNGGDPVEYTVATGTALVKGTLMILSSSPKTMTASSGDGQFFVGVLTADKTATDGVTVMSVITHAVINVTAGTGATTFGVPQKLSGANLVIDADDDTIANSMEVVGFSLETVADASRGDILINV